MKFFLLYFFLIISTVGFSQNNLTICGKVTELSVGPDLSIWLTTHTGNIYRTTNIDSTWEIVMETNPGIGYELASPHMDRILFFNSDTAIVYGYLTKIFYEEKKNKVYRTTDGGKTWEWIEFGKGDHWIRDGQTFKDGTCWLASNKGYFYYSKDFGKTWGKSPKIFKRVKDAYMRGPDIYSFHYLKDKIALAANKNNQLAISSNNFVDFKFVPTPLDYNLFKKEYRSYYLNGTGRKYIENMLINKVRIFANHYFVFQNNELYFTSKDKEEWKKYQLDIVGFEVDDSSNKMFAVTKEGKIIEILENFAFRELMRDSIKGEYIDMKIVDNKVIILTAIYKSDTGKDKIREQYGTLTVIEKNHKELTGYCIYQIHELNIKKIELKGK